MENGRTAILLAGKSKKKPASLGVSNKRKLSIMYET